MALNPNTPVSLTASDARRVGRSTGRVERLDLARYNGSRELGASRRSQRDRFLRVVNVTGSDSSNPGLWSGTVSIYEGYDPDTDTNTWAELSDSDCWVIPGPNGGELSSGQVFVNSQLVGEFDGLPIYSVEIISVGLDVGNTTTNPTGVAGNGFADEVLALTTTGVEFIRPGVGQAYHVIRLIAASVTQMGAVTTTTQGFQGDKSFNGRVTFAGGTAVNGVGNGITRTTFGLSGTSIETPVVNNGIVTGYQLISLPTYGNGTVTDFIFSGGDGVSGTVVTSTSTPTLTITLGNITPNSVGLPGGLKLVGKTSASGPATTTELPNNGDCCIHVNTTGPSYWLAINISGTIKSVELT